MDKKTLSVGLGSLLLVVLVALAVFYFAAPATFRGTAYVEPFPPAPAIELTRAEGQPFRLSDERGRIILLFFGYTSCPDVCPTTMAEMKLVMDKLGGQSGAVEVIFISVDPERDTPEKIQKYVEHFNPNFVGLSGSLEQLQVIWDSYGVYRSVNQSTSAMGYIVDHTARTLLIDQNGSLRLSYGFQTPVEDIVHDIRILLK